MTYGPAGVPLANEPTVCCCHVPPPRATPTWHSQDLEDKFSRYGRVTEARVVRHPTTRESRGFAFVVMSNEREAEEVGPGRRVLRDRA